ncbi:MAG: type I glyceraldehyde-3-phosphate dehydrogenase [Deltaproteobacteria bacterium]|nr:type I glyceraldehyde-3-phosphate dehydrogenase [Deltaproteobacteria bacterium]
MPITIGLMGFGRMGRNLFRLLSRSNTVRIGAISDIADHESLTYLLRYDTIFGRFPDLVTYKAGALYTWGRETPFLSAKDPGDVRWSDYGVDYVVEATGRDRARAELERHLAAGARRVLLCVPPREHPDISVVYGVNDAKLKPEHRLVSNASCTAHAAAPLLAILHDAFQVDRAHLTTVHAYTSVQRLADVPAADLRMSRAAAENIVPSETNAGAVIEEVLPELAGRVRSAALRVPVLNGSLVDLTVWLARAASVDRVNEVVKTAAAGPYRGIVEYQTDPIVSSDVAMSPYSSVFDSLATMVLRDKLVKTISWFDNSWGYCHRVVDLLRRFGRDDGKIAEGEA